MPFPSVWMKTLNQSLVQLALINSQGPDLKVIFLVKLGLKLIIMVIRMVDIATGIMAVATCTIEVESWIELKDAFQSFLSFDKSLIKGIEIVTCLAFPKAFLVFLMACLVFPKAFL